MGSYIPAQRNVTPWETRFHPGDAAPPIHRSPVSSGSGRNYGGSFRGDPEFNTPTLNKLTSFARNNVGNLLLYEAVIHKEDAKTKADAAKEAAAAHKTVADHPTDYDSPIGPDKPGGTGATRKLLNTPGGGLLDQPARFGRGPMAHLDDSGSVVRRHNRTDRTKSDPVLDHVVAPLATSSRFAYGGGASGLESVLRGAERANDPVTQERAAYAASSRNQRRK